MPYDQTNPPPPFQSPILPGGPEWPTAPLPKPGATSTEPAGAAMDAPLPTAGGATGPSTGTGPSAPPSGEDQTPSGSPPSAGTPENPPEAIVTREPSSPAAHPSGGSPEGDPWAAGGIAPVPPSAQDPVASAPIGSQPAAATPIPAPTSPMPPPAPKTEAPSIDLGGRDAEALVARMLGTWEGEGFNAIWVPNTSNGHFLMLDETRDRFAFEDVPGPIPNRGLLQPDIDMRGMTYMQRTTSAVTGNTMHMEPGILAFVPETTHPRVPATVVRLGAIPHGTSVLAQGLVTSGSGAPPIPNVDIVPFRLGQPSQRIGFNESNLALPEMPFRRVTGDVDQAKVDNPNAIVAAAIGSRTVKRFVKMDLTTDSSVAPGGGVANTAFLQGVPNETPNAQALKVTATFWLVTLDAGEDREEDMLLYSQSVQLLFNQISWPHVSVGTMRRVA